jgi:hypothetical protein
MPGVARLTALWPSPILPYLLSLSHGDVFLGGLGSNESCLAGAREYRRLVRGGIWIFVPALRQWLRLIFPAGRVACRNLQGGTCFTAQTAKLKEDDKTAID